MVFSSAQLKEKYGFVNPFIPDTLGKRALRYMSNGDRLLDIGCGEGADAVYFAGKGFEVRAIEKDKEYLKRFRAYRKDNNLSNITIRSCDVIDYPYPRNYYDAIICFLVGCCMRRSEFERMLGPVKQSVKPGGIIAMSLRNYLDYEFKEAFASRKMIEPNTFHSKVNCCNIRYYIEKGRLRELFEDFEILYYFEGLVPDKYLEDPEHGDSYVICRRGNDEK